MIDEILNILLNSSSYFCYFDKVDKDNKHTITKDYKFPCGCHFTEEVTINIYKEFIHSIKIVNICKQHKQLVDEYVKQRHS